MLCKKILFRNKKRESVPLFSGSHHFARNAWEDKDVGAGCPHLGHAPALEVSAIMQNRGPVSWLTCMYFLKEPRHCGLYSFYSWFQLIQRLGEKGRRNLELGWRGGQGKAKGPEEKLEFEFLNCQEPIWRF